MAVIPISAETQRVFCDMGCDKEWGFVPSSAVRLNRHLTETVDNWCYHNCRGQYKLLPDKVFFELDDDAVIFVLREF